MFHSSKHMQFSLILICNSSFILKLNLTKAVDDIKKKKRLQTSEESLTVITDNILKRMLTRLGLQLM